MLIEFFIAQICLGGPSMDRMACAKAMEATAIQYEVKQNVAIGEKKISKIVEKKVEEVTGKEVLAVTLFAARTFKEKQLSTRLVKEDGMLPSVSTALGFAGGQITFGWTF